MVEISIACPLETRFCCSMLELEDRMLCVLGLEIDLMSIMEGADFMYLENTE